MPRALRDKVMQSARNKVLKKKSTLLYLAGADLSRDLGGELGAEGFSVVTQTTYRMAPVRACRATSATALPRMASRRCCITPGAVRGPSWTRPGTKASKSRRWRSRNAACPRRSPACCAMPERPQVLVAATPDENALFDALERALRTRLA